MSKFKIGDKVRIVKCMACFCPIILLGKVDTVVKIGFGVTLEKYGAPEGCLEKVEDDAVDIEMEYTPDTVWQSEVISACYTDENDNTVQIDPNGDLAKTLNFELYGKDLPKPKKY